MENKNTVALSEKLIATYLAYRFLGKAFFEAPAVELLEQLKQDDLFADWPLDCTNDTMRNGLDTLQRFLQEWQVEKLRPYTARLYALSIGPGHLLAPPWESVYSAMKNVSSSIRKTLQARLLFHQFGMAVPTVRHEPEDHFGLEMMFVPPSLSGCPGWHPNRLA